MTKKRKIIVALSLASVGVVAAGSTVAALVKNTDSAPPAQPASLATAGKNQATAQTTTIDGGSYKYQSSQPGDSDDTWSLLSKYGDTVIYAPNLAFPLKMASSLLPVLKEGQSWQATPRARVIYQRFADASERTAYVQNIDGSTVILQYPVKFSFDDAPLVTDGDSLVVTYRVVNADGSLEEATYDVVFRLYRETQVQAVQGQSVSITSEHKVVGSLAELYDLSKLAGELPQVNEGYLPWSSPKYYRQRFNQTEREEYVPGANLSEGDKLWVEYTAIPKEGANVQPYTYQVGFAVVLSDLDLEEHELREGTLGLSLRKEGISGQTTNDEVKALGLKDLAELNSLYSFSAASVQQLDPVEGQPRFQVTFAGTPTEYNGARNNLSVVIEYVGAGPVIRVYGGNYWIEGAQISTTELSSLPAPNAAYGYQWTGKRVLTPLNDVPPNQPGAVLNVAFPFVAKAGYAGPDYLVYQQVRVVSAEQRPRYVVNDTVSWLQGFSTSDNAYVPVDDGYASVSLLSRKFFAEGATTGTDLLNSNAVVNNDGTVVSTYLVNGQNQATYAVQVNSKVVKTTSEAGNKPTASASLSVVRGLPRVPDIGLPKLPEQFAQQWKLTGCYVVGADQSMTEISENNLFLLPVGTRFVARYEAARTGTGESFTYNAYFSVVAEPTL